MSRAIAPKSKRRERVMAEVLGGGLGNIITHCFALMEVAEDMIREAKEDHPEEAAKIDRVFGIAYPTPLMRGKIDAVYRAHLAELIERVRNGEDTRPGTKAEVLCALLDSSLTAPLNRNAQALAERLWHELMPHVVVDADERTDPKWHKADLEVLETMRHKLRDSDRRIKERK